MDIDLKHIPKHVAIIMDGNGRWAKERNMPRVLGHERGMKTLRLMVEESVKLHIEYLTLFAFSSENWKRPKTETDFLMNLAERFVDAELESIHREDVRIRTIGHIEGLPERVQLKFKKAVEQTKGNTRMTLILALNYGARQEILDAVKRFVGDVDKTNGAGQKALESLSVEHFSQYLDTADFPDPDLLIRTSGEMRLSNFLLWQCSYSEFYVSKKYWPEFNAQDLHEAIKDFGERHRRFGAIA